ncbi:MAG: hypothetical protein ACKV2O_09980 [Acidimicrobiales bacterium]
MLSTCTTVARNRISIRASPDRPQYFPTLSAKWPSSGRGIGRGGNDVVVTVVVSVVLVVVLVLVVAGLA